MPCCIGIIDYAQCQHSTLYKLGCTAECDELCAPSQQELLLRTRFRWRCEECHVLRYVTDADARTDRWNDRARRIIGRDRVCADGSARALRALALRDREEFEEQLLEERRLAQVEEIQYAEEWTSQYGRAVFALRHGSRGWRRRRLRRRLRQWRLRSDEDQRSSSSDEDHDVDDENDNDDDDDTADGPSEAETRPPADADDGPTEAARRQVEKLLAVQQWDLTVVRDVREETRRLVQGAGGGRGGAGFGPGPGPDPHGWPAADNAAAAGGG